MNHIQANFHRNDSFGGSFFPKSPHWYLARKFDVDIAINPAISPIRAHYKIELIVNHGTQSIWLAGVW